MIKLKYILIHLFFSRIISTNRISSWFGKIADAQLYKPLLKFLIKRYISYFSIDIEEYEFDIDKLTNFNAFFTRKLKPGRRSWAEGICSPVDGRVLSFGNIKAGQIFQVKANNYSEEALTGFQAFSRGSFITLYLSPGNYHRVHAPFDMNIDRIKHIPGKLLSVSYKNASKINNLYSENERVVLSGHSEFGKFNFVFVGALNVGRIRLSFLPGFKTNTGKTRTKTQNVDFTVKQGEELGYFELGSTIVILLDSDYLAQSKPELLERSILLGENLIP